MNNYNEFLLVLQDLHENVRNGSLTILDYEELSYKEAMKFLGEDLKTLLTEMDSDLRNDEELSKRYRINRKLKKSLVTTFDTIEYVRTEFFDKQNEVYVKLLDEKIGLKSYERFTDNSLIKVAKNATNHPYSFTGKQINPFDTISKNTIMNKIRKLNVSIDLKENENKKKTKILWIEADEDHMHSQKSDRKYTLNGNFMGKLIYIFDGYEKECEGRYKLLNKHVFSGLYEKRGENKALWEEVYEYIVNNYDINYLEKIYISGDGANWIKEGINIIPKSEFVLDEFHLNKYIDKIVNTLSKSKRKYAYCDIYRTIELDEKERFIDLISDMKLESSNEKVICESEKYIINNWDAIVKRILDNNVYGCSAESHVGHILSKRMSRNPMGWSKLSADKICHLRALQENYGDNAFKLVVLNTKEKDNDYYIDEEIKAYNTVKDKLIKPINKYNDWLYQEIMTTDNTKKAIFSNYIKNNI